MITRKTIEERKLLKHTLAGLKVKIKSINSRRDALHKKKQNIVRRLETQREPIKKKINLIARTFGPKLASELQQLIYLSEECDHTVSIESKYKMELASCREKLLAGISNSNSNEEPSEASQHVNLLQLLRFYSRGIRLNATISVPTVQSTQSRDSPEISANTVNFSVVNTKNRKLNALREEVQVLAKSCTALQSEINRSTLLIERGDAQKGWMWQMDRNNRHTENRIYLEEELYRKSREIADIENGKVVRLAEHTEKLMVHLKRESAAKVKSQKDSELRCKLIKQERTRCKKINKQIQKLEKQTNVVREGARVLELQLQMLEVKYIDLQRKLELQKVRNIKETNKVQRILNDARDLWSSAQEAIKERERLAEIEKKRLETMKMKRLQMARRRKMQKNRQLDLGQVSPIKRGRGKVGSSFRRAPPSVDVTEPKESKDSIDGQVPPAFFTHTKHSSLQRSMTIDSSDLLPAVPETTVNTLAFSPIKRRKPKQAFM